MLIPASVSEVWFEISTSCNHKCSFCYLGSPATRRDSHGRVLQVARAIRDVLSPRIITLAGGEPTMEKNWFSIARSFVDAGCEVYIATNGDWKDSETACQIKKAGVSGVQIPILSGEKNIHDSLVARKGALQKALASIISLIQLGVPVAMVYIHVNENAGDFESVAKIAGMLGLPIIFNSYLRPFDGSCEFPCHNQRQASSILQMASMAESYGVKIVQGSFPALTDSPADCSRKRLMNFLCVQSDGGMRMCPARNDSPGNILNISKEDVHSSIRAAWNCHSGS